MKKTNLSQDEKIKDKSQSLFPFLLGAGFFIIYIYLCDRYIRWDLDTIKYLIFIMYFLWIATFLLARKVTVYNHRFFLHPTSYIGQTEVNNQSNMRGFWAYLLFSFWMANMAILFGVLMFHYYTNFKYSDLFGGILYFTAFNIFTQGVIPINLFNWLHILVTAMVFTGMTAVNIFLLIFFIKFDSVFLFPVILPILSWMLVIFSLLYLASYLFRIRPGFFQKLWIFTISLVLFSCSVFFCSLK
ncbi:MAG: hypothetical protein DRO88_00420 [Promethearchaeia archaeon]|nr:MAG: hypothetical protein DRO88_00420 [Candidatus Lokiarchaeia archaeon]